MRHLAKTNSLEHSAYGDYQHNHGNCDEYGIARVCALSVARNLLYTCLKPNKRLLSLIRVQWQVNNSSIVLKSKQKGTSRHEYRGY